jgi:hypothetical protein
MNIPYAVINPPFSLEFREMPRKELREFFRWYMDQIPRRIDELTRVVKGSPGFDGWEPDLTPDSLDSLGVWFASHVETRERTPEEMRKIRESLTFPIKIGNWELTNRTFSLAIDIGMYFSQVLIKAKPSFQWQQPLGGKRFVYYGWPVLKGETRSVLSPTHMGITVAYSMAEKEDKGDGLRRYFNTWLNMYSWGD